jgi:hypothetical protein
MVSREQTKFGFEVGDAAVILRPSQSLIAFCGSRNPIAVVTGFTPSRVNVRLMTECGIDVSASFMPYALRRCISGAA